jgi:hypothetical protein
LGLVSSTIGDIQGAHAMMPSETAAGAQGYGLRVVGESSNRDVQLATEQVRRAAWEFVRRRFPTAVSLADNDQRLASPSLIVISINVTRTSLRNGPSEALECVVISARLVRVGVTGSLKPAEVEVLVATDLTARLAGPHSAMKSLMERLLR